MREFQANKSNDEPRTQKVYGLIADISASLMSYRVACGKSRTCKQKREFCAKNLYKSQQTMVE